MSKLFAKLGLILALAFAPALAVASPLTYSAAPFDTPQAGLAKVVNIVNNGLTETGILNTATSSSGASTCNALRCTITSESLTTAAGAVFTETITNSTVALASQVLCSVGFGSATAGQPAIATITPAAGSVVIKVQNIHASAALNGTITLSCLVYN